MASRTSFDRSKIERTKIERTTIERTKTEGFGRSAGSARPDGDSPASRPFKPRSKDERGFGSQDGRPGVKFGGRPGAKPGTRPTRPGAGSPQPFWKSADKRRPRKEAAESDFETRPVERDSRGASDRPGRSRFAAPKTKAFGARPSKFRTGGSKPSRPNKDRR